MAHTIITAKYVSRCHACHQVHIGPGNLIVKDGTGWSRVSCKEKKGLAQTLLQTSQATMLEKHNTALGVWGIPDGSIPTWTRADWLQLALKYNVLDDQGASLLKWYWRGIIHRALDD